MRHNWKKVKLGEVATIKGGKRLPKGAKLLNVKTNHPYIRLVDFSDGKINKKELMYIDYEIHKSVQRYTVNEKDILLSIVGTIGLVVDIDRSLDFANLTENAVKINRKEKSELENKYLAWFLKSKYGQHEIHKNSVGSTQLKLPIYGIKNIDVSLPPLSEQKAIARILGSLDDKIELNRQMNRTLEDMAQAIFKAWFVDFESITNDQAPLTNDYNFVDSELGPIPEGWRVGKLGDVCENIKDTIKPSDIPNDSPYISLQEMPKKCISLDEWKYSNNIESNKFCFKKGEILFGKLRPYFHKVGIAPLDGICSTDILVIRPKNPKYYSLVLGHLSSKSFVDFTAAASSGTRMPRTNWKDMGNYKIVISDEQTVGNISEKVKPMIDKIISNIFEIKTLTKTRDTLLPKLVSGEIGVN